MDKARDNAAPKRLRILVVEDDAVIAMLIEDMIGELAHEVAAVAACAADALRSIARGGIDFAILDVNLHGETSYPVADSLWALGVPFVFATGYGVRGIDRKYADVAVITKPFTPDRLAAVLPRD